MSRNANVILTTINGTAAGILCSMAVDSVRHHYPFWLPCFYIGAAVFDVYVMVCGVVRIVEMRRNGK